MAIGVDDHDAKDRRMKPQRRSLAAVVLLGIVGGCSLVGADSPSTWSTRTEAALWELLVDHDPYPIVRSTGPNLDAYQAAQLVLAARAVGVESRELEGLVAHLRAVWTPGISDSPIPATPTDAAALSALGATGVPIAADEIGPALAAARDQVQGDDLVDTSGARVIAVAMLHDDVAIASAANAIATAERGRDRCLEANDLWTAGAAHERARLIGSPCSFTREVARNVRSEFESWSRDPDPIPTELDGSIVAVGAELLEAGILDRAAVERVSAARFEFAAAGTLVADPVTITQLAAAGDRLGLEVVFGESIASAIRTAAAWDGRLADSSTPDPAALVSLADIVRLSPGGRDLDDVARLVDWTSPEIDDATYVELALHLDPVRLGDSRTTGYVAAIATTSDRAVALALEVEWRRDAPCRRDLAVSGERIADDASATLRSRAIATEYRVRCRPVSHDATDATHAPAAALNRMIGRALQSNDVVLVADAIEAQCILSQSVGLGHVALQEISRVAVDDTFGAYAPGTSLVTIEATRATAVVLAADRAGCEALRVV